MSMIEEESLPNRYSPETIDRLLAIAHNYAWTWDQSLKAPLDHVFGQSWDHDHHPIGLIKKLQADGEAPQNKDLDRLLTSAVDKLDFYSAEQPETKIAYISAEFGVAKTLPQYSGGLGILAGDHLKAASDLEINLVAVGLFYANGYFEQGLSGSEQTVSYQTYSPDQLGLSDTGVVVEVDTPNGPIAAAVWKTLVGRTQLYMLDTRVPQNQPWATAVTDQLYGGDRQKRLDQEWLLGIGGLRALKALGIDPAVIHMNEGHAGFCLLELLGEQLSHGANLAEARDRIRERVLFTTHTPVPAGIDQFSRELAEPYFKLWSENGGFAVSDIWPLGLLPSDEEPDKFNMAAFCLNHAGKTNGVSALHGEVSQQLFASLPAGKNITSITNGVHARTWVHPEVQHLLDKYLGTSWPVAGPEVWDKAPAIPIQSIRQVRNGLRSKMIDYLADKYQITGLDPNALTIGFARRFATYKRAALLLSEPEGLAELLDSIDKPVQFIFAGKAHPADTPGQEVFSQIAAFTKSKEAKGRFVLVPGYDISLALMLYAGCDLWLNTPIRPREASGTSGEKSALNGGINCSILDGWWAEWYDSNNGWAIEESTSEEPNVRDSAEAANLIRLLSKEVVPEFYAAGEGLSDPWCNRITRGWEYLGPKVTAARMVAQYEIDLYDPIIQSARQGSTV